MVRSPTTDHSREHEELAALYALQALEGDELAAYERHLAACAQCQDFVRRDRRTLVPLNRVPPEMEPSPGFKHRLLQRAAAELSTAGPAPAAQTAAARAPIPLPRRPVWTGVLAAAVAVLLGVAAVLGVLSYRGQVVATVALEGPGPGSGAVLLRRSGDSELRLTGLAALPAGHVYEAWVIPAGGQPIPAGTTATGQDTLPLPASVRGSTVAVTVEPSPGGSAPTTPPFLAATVTT